MTKQQLLQRREQLAADMHYAQILGKAKEAERLYWAIVKINVSIFSGRSE